MTNDKSAGREHCMPVFIDKIEETGLPSHGSHFCVVPTSEKLIHQMRLAKQGRTSDAIPLLG